MSGLSNGFMRDVEARLAELEGRTSIHGPEVDIGGDSDESRAWQAFLDHLDFAERHRLQEIENPFQPQGGDWAEMPVEDLKFHSRLVYARFPVFRLWERGLVRLTGAQLRARPRTGGHGDFRWVDSLSERDQDCMEGILRREVSSELIPDEVAVLKKIEHLASIYGARETEGGTHDE